MNEEFQRHLVRLQHKRYINLTTYRKDGSMAKTPVAFIIAGAHIYVSTMSSAGKLRRIRHRPMVLISAATWRGHAKGQGFSASAHILDQTDTKHDVSIIQRAFWQKYGLQKGLFDIVYRLRQVETVIIAITEIEASPHLS